MSDSANGTFEKIVEAATERVAEKGFERATQKDITLACFGMLNRQIKHEANSFKKPCRWLVSVLGAGILTSILVNFIG